MHYNEAQVFKPCRLDLVGKPGGPFFFFDDFKTFNQVTSSAEEYVVTNATSGTAVISDGLGGILTLDAGAATADQGVQVQLANEVFKVPTEKSQFLAFEARVKFGTTITVSQNFIGLSILDTTLIASGANSSTDHIGFELNAVSQAANAGYAQFVSEASGNRTTSADVKELATGTWYRLGFRVEGPDTIKVYIDGVEYTDAKITSNIPTTEMSLALVCQAEGTGQPTCDIDWIAVYNDR